MRSDVTAVSMMIQVFWGVTPSFSKWLLMFESSLVPS